MGKYLSLFSIVGFIIVVFSLSQTARNTRPESVFLVSEHIKSDDKVSYKRVVIPFQLTKHIKGINTHQLTFETSEIKKLVDSDNVGLLFVSNWMEATIQSARIVISDTTESTIAVYEVKANSSITENKKIVFKKKFEDQSKISSKSQKVVISILSSGSPDLGVVAAISDNEPISKLLWKNTLSIDGIARAISPVCWIDSKNKSKDYTKAQLLSYLWGLETANSKWIYIALTIACIIWTIGVVVLSYNNCTLAAYSFYQAFSVSLLFLSIGLVYSIITPPFEGPDEPNHLLTYAWLNNIPRLEKSALELANLGHLERIKFRNEEKLASIDVGSPKVGNWASHILRNDPNRSPSAKMLWELVNHFLRSENSSITLFTLRLINVLLVAICVFVSLSTVGYLLRMDSPIEFIAATFMLTPSIGYFSSVFSNYPILIGGYILQAVSIGLIWQKSTTVGFLWQRLNIVGLLAGTGLVISIISSDNGIFAVAFWITYIPLYWLFIDCNEEVKQQIRESMFKFCLAFSLPFILCYLTYLLVNILHPGFEILPAILVWSFEHCKNHVLIRFLKLEPIIFLALPATIYLFSVMSNYLSLEFKNRARVKITPRTSILLLLIAVLCIWIFPIHKMFVSYQCDNLVYSVLKTIYFFVEGFIVRKPDWFIVNSFWGCFGWLDTPLPDLVITILRSVAAFGLLLLFVFSIVPKNSGIESKLLFNNMISVCAFLVFLSIGYWFFHFSVNSRYLIGPYLLILIPAYEGYRRLSLQIFTPRAGRPKIAFVFLAACMTIQCTAWLTIIDRYF